MREALVNFPILQISFASATVSLRHGERRAVGVIWQRLPKLVQLDVTRYKRHAMAMNINLTPQLEEMVRQKVVSGLYTSASEVVREALRLMEGKDRLLAARLAQLRQDIQEGLDSGPAVAWDVAELKAAGRAKRKAKSSSGV